MALQVNFDSAFGVSFPEAYARITTASIDKAKTIYNVDVYANASVFAAGCASVGGACFEMETPQSGQVEGIVAELYANLKTRSGFDVWVDV